MTYEINEIILAAEYNTFGTNLNTVYSVGTGDSGYGQTAIVLSSVAIGKLIESSEWDDLLTAAEVCRAHQGSVTTFPPNSQVAVAEVIEAHESGVPTSDAFDIDGNITILSTNRLIPDVSSVTVFSNVLNSSRAVAWSNSISHTFTATFTTVDDARYFFNSGGEIRIRGSRSGGTGTSQNTSWTTLLANMGTVTFNYTNTIAGGSGTGSALGYYDLGTAFTQIYSITSTGAYVANDVLIQARTADGPGGSFGDNGRIIEFRVSYNDDHTNAFFDQVSGTITSDIDIRRATSPLSILAPTMSTSNGLSVGGS